MALDRVHDDSYCGNPPAEPHGCPFQTDVWNDPDYLCDCCPQCEDDCADDI